MIMYGWFVSVGLCLLTFDFRPMPSRGWIVPVGGSTPDRLQVPTGFDRLRPAALGVDFALYV